MRFGRDVGEMMRRKKGKSPVSESEKGIEDQRVLCETYTLGVTVPVNYVISVQATSIAGALEKAAFRNLPEDMLGTRRSESLWQPKALPATRPTEYEPVAVYNFATGSQTLNWNGATASACSTASNSKDSNVETVHSLHHLIQHAAYLPLAWKHIRDFATIEEATETAKTYARRGYTLQITSGSESVHVIYDRINGAYLISRGTKFSAI